MIKNIILEYDYQYNFLYNAIVARKIVKYKKDKEIIIKLKNRVFPFLNGITLKNQKVIAIMTRKRKNYIYVNINKMEGSLNGKKRNKSKIR